MYMVEIASELLMMFSIHETVIAFGELLFQHCRQAVIAVKDRHSSTSSIMEHRVSPVTTNPQESRRRDTDRLKHVAAGESTWTVNVSAPQHFGPRPTNGHQSSRMREYHSIALLLWS